MVVLVKHEVVEPVFIEVQHQRVLHRTEERCWYRPRRRFGKPPRAVVDQKPDVAIERADVIEVRVSVAVGVQKLSPACAIETAWQAAVAPDADTGTARGKSGG